MNVLVGGGPGPGRGGSRGEKHRRPKAHNHAQSTHDGKQCARKQPAAAACLPDSNDEPPGTLSALTAHGGRGNPLSHAGRACQRTQGFGGQFANISPNFPRTHLLTLRFSFQDICPTGISIFFFFYIKLCGQAWLLKHYLKQQTCRTDLHVH